MSRAEREVRAAVLQREAAALGDDGGPIPAVVAVDEGDGIAVGVGDAEVDGVAVGVGGGAVGGDWGGLGGIEEFSAFGEVGGGDEFGGGDFGNIGVGDPPVGVGEGDAEGFYEGVEVAKGYFSRWRW
jgi:hypothetical protein